MRGNSLPGCEHRIWGQALLLTGHMMCPKSVLPHLENAVIILATIDVMRIQ